jgi:peptidoglycan DL-endopeptidase CwlO
MRALTRPQETPPLTMSIRPPRRLVHLASTTAVAVTLVGLVAAPAVQAAPGGSKQSQAADIQNQIEQTDVQISALAEKLNDATARRDAAQQSVQDAEQQIASAKAQVDGILKVVEQNLASLYRRTLRGSSVSEMDFGDATDLLKRAQYSHAQNSHDDALLNKLDAAQQDLAADRDDARRARDAAAAETNTIAEAKSAFEAARAEQQGVLDKIKGEIAQEVAAEKARREAAVRAQFSGAPVKYPDVGPPNGSAAQAIAFARGVIGAGYSTNPRMGPTYDCSGLVISAWGAAGVSLPGGSSGSMYASLPHIPMDSMQPGDLVFWGAGGSSHVALYVGGGEIIDAGNSSGVSQRAIWGSPVGAARVV